MTASASRPASASAPELSMPDHINQPGDLQHTLIHLCVPLWISSLLYSLSLEVSAGAWLWIQLAVLLTTALWGRRGHLLLGALGWAALHVPWALDAHQTAVFAAVGFSCSGFALMAALRRTAA